METNQESYVNENIQKFQSVCDCNQQQAQFYLEACQGDFQEAIQMFFTQEEQGNKQQIDQSPATLTDMPSTSQSGFEQFQYTYNSNEIQNENTNIIINQNTAQQPRQQDSRSPITSNGNNYSSNTNNGQPNSPNNGQSNQGGGGGGILFVIRQAIFRTMGGLSRSLLSIISFSLHSFIQVVNFALGILGSIGQLIIPSRMRQILKGFFEKIFFGSKQESPTEEATSFVNYFKSTYVGNQSSESQQYPQFKEVGFSEAQQTAKRNFKFLFVYLHSPMNQDSNTFCRSTLCNREVADFINQNFDCWGGNVEHQYAHKVSQMLQVSAYPYCSLVAQTGSRSAIVAQTIGNVQYTQFLDTLRQAQTNHQIRLEQQRISEQEMVASRTIRDEQEIAFQESQKKDQTKFQKLQEEKLKKQQVEQELARLENIQREKVERKQQKIRQQHLHVAERKQIKQQVVNQILGQEDKVLNVSIRLRMPSGQNYQSKFNSQDKVQLLYDFAESIEDNNYFKFLLCTNYPRIELNQDSLTKTLSEMQISSQAIIFLQPEEEDDSESE